MAQHVHMKSNGVYSGQNQPTTPGHHRHPGLRDAMDGEGHFHLEDLTGHPTGSDINVLPDEDGKASVFGEGSNAEEKGEKSTEVSLPKKSY